MKRTRVNPKSAKQTKKEERYFALLQYLVDVRAEGKCELCGKYLYPLGYYGHHIRKRAQAGLDVPSNLLILCRTGCHDHLKYPSGTRLTEEEQLKLVEKRNLVSAISDDGWNYRWGLSH